MKRADAETDDFGMVEVIRYMARSEKPIDDGHLLADLDCPRFKAFTFAGDDQLKGSVMYNPFGRLKLVSMRDLAERN